MEKRTCSHAFLRVKEQEMEASFADVPLIAFLDQGCPLGACRLAGAKIFRCYSVLAVLEFQYITEIFAKPKL